MVMAFRRRSLALALIAIGFAAQWIPWARIDRAAFQYHYYTALPFVVLALAYFVAELWHGASRRTWLLARIAAAVAIVGAGRDVAPRRPLCAFVGVESVNPGSQACPAVIPDFVLTARTAGLAGRRRRSALFVIVPARPRLRVDGDGASAAAVGRVRLSARSSGPGSRWSPGSLVVALLPDTAILTLTSIPVEPIALIVGDPARLPRPSRSSRRATRGGSWSASASRSSAGSSILYPNIAALPLPSAVVNAYQGILPTYLYAFQFPVSTVTATSTRRCSRRRWRSCCSRSTVTCLVVAYSAWVWRLALAESRPRPARTRPTMPDGLARTGGA